MWCWALLAVTVYGVSYGASPPPESSWKPSPQPLSLPQGEGSTSTAMVPMVRFVASMAQGIL